ncbi:MAG: ornithine cyclodeaminase family protein [Pirellulales bacterium]|nr:ornithine cyclodeaminase family protein [Pirellulales bacterium]
MCKQRLMKPIEFLYLSQEDVIGVEMPMADVITVVEDALTEHGLGYYENPPKPALHPLPQAYSHAMPGYLSRKKVAGIKWVSGFFGNPEIDLPSLMGLTVLNDVETGQPLAVMDCGWITAMRTGEVSGVATKYLALPDVTSIGVVGTGVQGHVNVLAIAEVAPSLQLV